MGKLGFFYDAARCTGCRACQVACKEKNKLAAGDFCRRVDTVETIVDNERKWMHFSGACNHCEKPACAEVCPTGAMYKAEDGTVQHRDDLCIGCGRCVHNCPYGAPSLNKFTGYAQKCDACVERRNNSRQPACVEACPMRALHFGEMEELRTQFGEYGAALPFLPSEELTSPCLMVRGVPARANEAAVNAETLPEQMPQTDSSAHIVILGGGAAAVSAAREIRRRSKTAKVTLIGREKRLPYCRPMLSKGLLNSFAMDRYPIVEESWLQENDVAYIGGMEVTGLDAKGHAVTLADGRTISYDKCIYALGADCFVPPIPGRELAGVYTLRYDRDLHRIRQAMLTARSAVIIGGGITGLELAWEMKKAGLQVTVLDAMEQLMGRILDVRSAELLRNAVEKAGVRVMTHVSVREIAGNGCVERVVLADGECEADMVILSTGYRANTVLAAAAGLAAERNVTVNEKMETSQPDVYACGDCTNSSTATWLRSVHQGAVAGANALGAELRYTAEAEPAMVHTAGTSLMTVGDMGKQAAGEYCFVCRFYVNQKVEGRENTHFTFCLCEDKLVGAALVGNLESMQWVQQAVDTHWDVETLKKTMTEKGVEIDGQ